MFTLQDIDAAHAHVKTGADFPRYAQTVKALGVQRYETFVFDGHTEYFGADGYRVMSDAKHPVLEIANESDSEHLLERLAAHQRGETDYLQFSKDVAAAGAEKWVIDLQEMTCTYYDKQHHALHQEKIPNV